MIVRRSLGNRVSRKSPAVVGRLALPETRVWRLIAEGLKPIAVSLNAKLRCPPTYVIRALAAQYFRSPWRFPRHIGELPW